MDKDNAMLHSTETTLFDGGGMAIIDILLLFEIFQRTTWWLL